MVELGTTTSVITHNASIGAIAHRIIHLSGGHISGIDANSARASVKDLTW